MGRGEFFGKRWRVEQCSGGTPLECFRSEFVAIELIPAQTDIEIAGLDRSSVLVEAGNFDFGMCAEKFGTRHGSDFLQWKGIHQASPPFLSEIARAATATSSKGAL